MLLNALIQLTAAVAAVNAAAIPVPTATLNDNQVISGLYEGEVETFKGIPFAEPPVGTLRYKKPIRYSASYAGLQANVYKDSCMQVVSNSSYSPELLHQLPSFVVTALNSSSQEPLVMSEDCLHLNVFRPRNTTADDKLPVMVYIYGGSFLTGSAPSSPGNKFIEESIAMNERVIYVSFNYRLGTFGFLGGAGPTGENSTNVGLHDQREALKWVQDHIANFGGDPEQVMLFGESAGAMSVGHQMVAYGGDNTYNGKKLFSSTVLQSGGVLSSLDVNSTAPNSIFELFAHAAGCGEEESPKDVMLCLRGLPDVKVLAAQAEVLATAGYASTFLGLSPRPDGDILPSDTFTLVKENKIAQVPFMVGTNEDDGTMFGIQSTNITNSTEVQAWTHQMLPGANASTIKTLLELYPQDPAAGCPYRRGDKDAITPEYKRLSSILNDLLFKAPSRLLLEHSTQKHRYSFTSTALHDLVPVLGTFHASDILFQYFVDLGPYQSFRRYWISFANHHDPNHNTDGLAQWDAYTKEGKQELDIQFYQNEMSNDTVRAKPIEFLLTNEQVRV